jgi:serine/threonine protein kinase
MVVKHCKQLSVQYQTQSKERWSVVERLGTMNGGLNAGIAKVQAKRHPGMVFIEKRFGAKEFKHKAPYREIQMLYQVGDHRNVAKMADHFLDESTQTAAVFLEYCNQGNLESIVAHVADGKHVNEHKVWSWFIQLTEAVAYLHRGPNPSMSDDELHQSRWSRMFHRDIKPGNILLTIEDGQIAAKLSDFGCAISEDFSDLESNEDYTITRSMWTNGYDPPEHPLFSGASDIWQLGLSMMSLCMGTMRPRSGNNPDGEFWDEKRPAGVRYSKELSRTLMLCLEKDRKKRFTAYPIEKILGTQYDKIASELPADTFPLDIFDRRDVQGPEASQFAPVLGNDQAVHLSAPHYAQPVRAVRSPWAGNFGFPTNDYGHPVPRGASSRPILSQ